MTNRDRGQRDDVDDLDALISAEIDEELDLGERARLNEMIAGDRGNAAATRAQAFRAIDQAVHELADVSTDEARLSANFLRLRERLGLGDYDPASLNPAMAWPMVARRALFPIAAAAAALVLYLNWPVSESAMERDLHASSSSSIDLDLQDELEFVLGYGD